MPITAPRTPEIARARAQTARRTATLGANHPDTLTARCEMVTATLAEHIRRVVSAAPPLSADQRDRLAGLLRKPGSLA